jgi:hypothetical protein
MLNNGCGHGVGTNGLATMVLMKNGNHIAMEAKLQHNIITRCNKCGKMTTTTISSQIHQLIQSLFTYMYNKISLMLGWSFAQRL